MKNKIQIVGGFLTVVFIALAVITSISWVWGAGQQTVETLCKMLLTNIILIVVIAFLDGTMKE